ncbi:hypothetical protein JW979_10470, partial [bacterium]|nr:hypothetical protein [candidate division CSSED10-310 bacterium]
MIVQRFPVTAVLGYIAIDDMHIIDEFPRRGEKSRIRTSMKFTGGQAATAAIALHRWGCPVRLIGAIGDDTNGSVAINTLIAEGIDAEFISIRNNALTQHAVIVVDILSGERTIFWQRHENLNLTTLDVKKDWLDQCRMLLIDGHEMKADLQAVEWIKSNGGKVVLDAEEAAEGWETLFPMVDVVVVSSDFGRRYLNCESPENVVNKLRSMGCACVGVTLGNQGYIADWGDGLIVAGSLNVAVKDTTGAGDIFHAGIVFGMLNCWTFDKAFT